MEKLMKKHNIFCIIDDYSRYGAKSGYFYARISCQIYNEIEDMKKLAKIIK